MDIEDFLEYIDNLEDAVENIRIPKRYIRDAEDPFTFYEDREFVRRYRFRKTTVRDVLLQLVTEALQKPSNRGLPVQPVVQLLIALRFYASGNFQLVSGDLRGISQASVSLIIKRVSVAFAQHLRYYVKFPQERYKQQDNIRKFYEIANFPNVAACVDGTHILIANPGGVIGEIFRNRKRQFSLNVQVACGPDMEILDIDVRHPGSTHDNVIFERSSLRVRFEQHLVEGLLLGDNGYACRRYLLTPVLHPLTQAEQNYNRSHIRTRNIVERVFGLWKRRFPCLRRILLTKVETSVAIICAVAVLQNISRLTREDEIPEDNQDNIDLPIHENVIEEPDGDRFAFRRTFILIHFQ